MTDKRAFAPGMLSRRSFVRLAGCSGLVIAAAGLSGCGAQDVIDAMFTGMRDVHDSTDRKVQLPIPGKLSRIYVTSPLAQIFCFTMAPNLLAGTALSFSKRQLDFLPAGTEDLPYLGSMSGGGVIDVEALKQRDVQVIFSISGVGISEVNVADALELERQSGIPVFLIDGSFDRIGDTYRLLGNVLGCSERAEELAAFCEGVYREVTDAVARVPESERVRFYFAEGPEGLQTEPNASQHAQAFLVAGGVNVAADEPLPAGETSMADVDIEQVAAWDPDVIVAWDWESRAGAGDYIRANPDWRRLRAVREGNVHDMPSVPFPFCDRPPGVNRFLGVQWLANLFYPGYYDVDMVEKVREFYRTCYWRDITRDQARKILGLEEW